MRLTGGHRAAAFISGLVLAVFSAMPSWADYAITGFSGKTVYTKAYWIQGNTIFLSEGPETFNVYEVESITPQNLSREEAEARAAVMNVFAGRVDRFLETEKAIADAQAAYAAGLSGKEAGLDVQGMDRKEKKAFTSGLEALGRSLDELKSSWEQTMIPDFPLLLMRDIKLLQLSSLEASIEMTVRYAETEDPTYREYAKAFMAQYGSFEESFRQRLPGK